MNEMAIRLGKQAISQRLLISEEYLEYIGYSDTSWKKEGSALLQYNVILKDHAKYKSTVAHMYMGN